MIVDPNKRHEVLLVFFIYNFYFEKSYVEISHGEQNKQYLTIIA